MYIEKHTVCQRDYRIQLLWNVQHVHGDLCKHLGIDEGTDQEGLSGFIYFL